MVCIFIFHCVTVPTENILGVVALLEACDMAILAAILDFGQN